MASTVRDEYSRRDSDRELGRGSGDGRRHKGREIIADDKQRRRKYTPVREVPAPARGKAPHSSSADWDDQKRRPDSARHGRVVPKTPPPPVS